MLLATFGGHECRLALAGEGEQVSHFLADAIGSFSSVPPGSSPKGLCNLVVLALSDLLVGTMLLVSSCGPSPDHATPKLILIELVTSISLADFSSEVASCTFYG
ncbi:hypothetical protein V6N13_006138 [Hibiscus sabdariffa]